MNYFEENPHIAMIMYVRNILRNWIEGYEEAIYAAVKCPEPAAFICPYYEDESSKSKGAKAKSKKALKAG